MTFDGTCERGGVQRAPQEIEERVNVYILANVLLAACHARCCLLLSAPQSTICHCVHLRSLSALPLSLSGVPIAFRSLVAAPFGSARTAARDHLAVPRYMARYLFLHLVPPHETTLQCPVTWRATYFFPPCHVPPELPSLYIDSIASADAAISMACCSLGAIFIYLTHRLFHPCCALGRRRGASSWRYPAF
jgi:hypothetical protein